MGTRTTTLCDLLDGPEVSLSFLEDGEVDGARTTWSRGEIKARANRAASHIATVAEPGERALLVFQPGLDYLAALLGCGLVGVTPVPAYPPDPTRLDRTLPRLAAIAHDAKPRALLTSAAMMQYAGVAREVAALSTLPWIATDLDGEGALPNYEANPDELALLQYTSGSTQRPRGVELTHAQLVANIEAYCTRYEFGPTDHLALWLPTFHDMGLIGGLLTALYAGFSLTFFAPHHFLQRPTRWLECVSRTRATYTGAPNFAWDLAARRSTAAERSTLDLSSLRVAVTAAEPVRAATLDGFSATFASAGFDRASVVQCYGLAETGLFVCGSEPGARLKTLERSGKTLLGAGSAPHLAIVDEDGREVADGAEGEIWFSGPGVGRGYFGDAEASAHTFGARREGDERRWLRTGDLGVRADGELFVTGRAKDLIIVRGRNLYPQDLEAIAEGAHADVRPGGAIAFAMDDGTGEGITIVAEVKGQAADDAVAAAIARAVSVALEIAPCEVALIPARTLPKTSSGKVQRSRARSLLAAGELEVLARWRASPEDVLGLVVAELRGLSGDDKIEPTCSLQELALDSFMLVELAGALEDATGISLDPRELYELRSIEALATLLEARGAVVSPRAERPPIPIPSQAPEGSWLERQRRMKGGASNAAIRAHYDLSNAFFALFLDEGMVYSAARFNDERDDLAGAQRAKLNHHLDAAGVTAGSRVLDVGCGWGALVDAALARSAKPLGITASAAQAEHCGARPVRVERWEDHEGENAYDAVISIGALEHFAGPDDDEAARVELYTRFCARAARWLRPAGRLSLQFIAWSGERAGALHPFIREVFPESGLPVCRDVELALARAGFVVDACEHRPEDYARTLALWQERLRRSRTRADALAGGEQTQRFLRYLRHSRAAFEGGQLTLVRLAARAPRAARAL